MTTKHAPTPWTVEKTSTNLKPPYLKDRHSIHDQIGQEIASVHYWNGEPNEANAAFIVRACNSHDELVAALKKCKTCSLNSDVLELVNNALGNATK